MDDRQFKTLLEHLGYSFEGYRRVRKGVKKRIRRHMHALECRDVATYLAYLADSPVDREACLRLMTVSISRFMRDRLLWEALGGTWLPALHGRFGPRLRAWSAGCACGEEAYSLAIVHQEAASRLSSDPPLELTIRATDLNPAVLTRAWDGIYPASSLREMPVDLREHYFQPLRGGRRYRIRSVLGAAIEWGRQDLTSDPPEQACHLVLLRNNILTYLDGPRQAPIIKKVLECLRPGGLLVIGSREKLPGGFPELRPVAEQIPYAFRRRPPHDDISRD